MKEPILNSHNKSEYEPAHTCEHVQDSQPRLQRRNVASALEGHIRAGVRPSVLLRDILEELDTLEVRGTFVVRRVHRSLEVFDGCKVMLRHP